MNALHKITLSLTTNKLNLIPNQPNQLFLTNPIGCFLQLITYLILFFHNKVKSKRLLKSFPAKCNTTTPTNIKALELSGTTDFFFAVLLNSDSYPLT